VSKLTSLSDALDRHVGDGASVYVTGFTHLIDFAAAHELARRRVRDLTLIRMTPTSCTSTWRRRLRVAPPLQLSRQSRCRAPTM
jgi:acyl CoA:acetate/3-ketoacid CoA transferase alpha subunit